MNKKKSVFGPLLMMILAIASPLAPVCAQVALPDEQAMISRRLRLSYTDPARCVQLLKLYGFSVGALNVPVNRAELPVVILLPETKFHETIPDESKVFPHTETDPINEILVFYDPVKPEQFGAVSEVVRKQIDLPARQIMIEAMVLEISSTALQELGVQWDLTNELSSGNFFNRKIESTTDLPLRIGRLVTPAEGSDQLDVTVKNVFREFNVRLRSLIKDGSAEIISRPSVLTLDNRMAYINVSERIPIANTKFVKDYVSSVDFRDVTAGIKLVVRPRVSEDSEEISMQINASVTARVPGKDKEVLGQGNIVLASAPTLSVREVKTYARIANDTPFIIGGLIAKDSEETIHRVPLVSKLPLLGNLFRNRAVSGLKREVIIVITPFVLPDEKIINKSMPKDEDRFDSFGNKLFRDAYRIRAEDTFDLQYLRENRQLKRMQSLADRIITENVNLADQEPYVAFGNGVIPGEGILVRRQIYEVLKRREVGTSLEVENLIFFEPDKRLGSGFEVRFFNDFLESKAPSVLSKSGGKKALAIAFTLRRMSDSAADLLKEPVPEMKLIDCLDSAAWSQLLWDMNKPDADGRRRHAIILRNKGDIERLKLAILMKKTVALNTEQRILSLQNFTRGRLLLMPTVRPEDVELIDAEVAKCFYCSELYYQALQSELEADFISFRKAIKGTPYEDFMKDDGK
jgi:general secretion pathway protein D